MFQVFRKDKASGLANWGMIDFEGKRKRVSCDVPKT